MGMCAIGPQIASREHAAHAEAARDAHKRGRMVEGS
jgi:hypothetical protein